MPKMKYAGFWRRFAAYILDEVIFMIVLSLPFSLIPKPNMYLNFGVAAVLVWLYSALLESSKYQATVGKMALGIKVTDMQGKRISFARATGRYFAKFISTIIFCIGFLMIAFTEKKQGLHDIIADCLVIKEK